LFVGPLWIDVLVRENYTSDSGAMIVPVLEQLAEFYIYADGDQTTANELRLVASKVITSVNRYLWAPSGDHLVTRLNLDKTTTRDFVDYDSNLIAVAFGVIPDANVSSVLQRVDSGSYTHVRATWCSEIPYSGDAPDCYIVGGTVCGDSVVTLARIGWVDSLARQRVKDAATVRNILLAPLQQDLLANTWLNERYNSSGDQVRTDFYFEYPSLITIMLREVVYGINIGLTTVTISPLLLDDIPSFTYRIGNIYVKFNPAHVELSLPGVIAQSQSKTCTIRSLYKRVPYQITPNSNCATASSPFTVVSDESGSVTFDALFSTGCVFTVKSEEA
jgi:hypothetical protein